MYWQYISESDFFEFLNEDYKLVVLETLSGAEDIFNVNLSREIIMLAGNESHGLPNEVIEKADLKIYIPMPGGCKSINVSHALAVAGFEWYRQMMI